MSTSNFSRLISLQNRWWFRAALIAVLFLFSLLGLLNISSSLHGDATPGGNVANQVVRSVDIAKPAVVHIITTIGGRITVHFPHARSVAFPLNGGTYKLGLSGSGTFISAHGDVLTTDHVINPPRDQQLDLYLQAMAAQDIADYSNHALATATPYTRVGVLSDLKTGHLVSQSRYDNPTSEVYLSTDYIGTSIPSSWLALPAGIHAPIDKVEMESAVDAGDLAIIHVRMENTPGVQLGNSSDVAQQDMLTIIGFSGSADLSTPATLVPNNVLTSSINEIYVSAVKNTSNGIPIIEAGGNIEPGNSGAPALDHNGQIVGIVDFCRPQDCKQQNLPVGASFLQVSNGVHDMLQDLAINTTPGPLQKAWSQAMSDYASTTPGHWHKALYEFQQITVHFPSFLGVTPYLRYARIQASHEQSPFSQPRNINNDNRWLLVGGGAVAAIILLTAILLVGFLLSRAKKKVAAVPVGEQFMETSPMGEPSASVQPPMTPSAPLSEPTDPVLASTPSPPPSEAVIAVQEVQKQEPEPLVNPVDTSQTVVQMDFDGTPLAQDADWDHPTDPKLPIVQP